MLKILYCAGNNYNALIQLTRFMAAIKGKPYIIKIAAFKKSSPKHLQIDWTLDCLLNIFDPDYITFDNDNFKTYYNQVKYFSPDLIISDLEYFSSYIANELNITLWQCSSSIINFALDNKYKYDLGVFSKYAFLFNRMPIHTQRIVNIIDNSNCNFVYSHFGDSDDPPPIKSNFEWIRPYHKIGKVSIPCQHNIIAASINSNKTIIDTLNKLDDSILFTNNYEEKYSKLLIKDISNYEEYVCNLKNSNLFISEGQTSFLADAFYNNKYAVSLPNVDDPECVLNSIISEKLKLSTSIYNLDNLNKYMNLPVQFNYNKNIMFLDQKVAEI